MTCYNSILIDMEYQRIENLDPYDYDGYWEDDNEPDKELVTVPPTESEPKTEYIEF